MSTIAKGNKVIHKTNQVEMIVVSADGERISCEYLADDGEYVLKVYNKDFLTVISKNPGITMTEDMLVGW